MSQVRLDTFNPRKHFCRGRPLWFEAAWYGVKVCFFLSAIPWPSRLKCALLRLFGAKVGAGVVIKPRVNIHMPWRLSIGDFSWMGEEVFILNLEQVDIGAHCCISQRAFLCTGNHDWTAPDFPYRNRPITLGDGVWVGAQCLVGPGVSIGASTVLTAGSVATTSLPGNRICQGNPAQPQRERFTVI